MFKRIDYIVYEDNQLWIEGVKKRKIDKKIIDEIKSFYERNKFVVPKKFADIYMFTIHIRLL